MKILTTCLLSLFLFGCAQYGKKSADCTTCAKAEKMDCKECDQSKKEKCTDC